MRSLGIRCKSCGHEFGTGILYGVYGRPVLGAATWPCPSCGAARRYRTEDYVVLGSSAPARGAQVR